MARRRRNCVALAATLLFVTTGLVPVVSAGGTLAQLWSDIQSATHPPDARRLPASVHHNGALSFNYAAAQLFHDDVAAAQINDWYNNGRTTRCRHSKVLRAGAEAIAGGGDGILLESVALRTWAAVVSTANMAPQAAAEAPFTGGACPLEGLVAQTTSTPPPSNHSISSSLSRLRTALQNRACAVTCGAGCKTWHDGVGHVFLRSTLPVMVFAEWLGCRYVRSDLCSVGEGMRINIDISNGFFHSSDPQQGLLPYYCHQLAKNFNYLKNKNGTRPSSDALDSGTTCFEVSWPLWLNEAATFHDATNAFGGNVSQAKDFGFSVPAKGIGNNPLVAARAVEEHGDSCAPGSAITFNAGKVPDFRHKPPPENWAPAARAVVERLRAGYNRAPRAFRYHCGVTDAATFHVTAHVRLGDRAQSFDSNTEKNMGWTEAYVYPIAEVIATALALDQLPFTTARVSVFTELSTLSAMRMDAMWNTTTVPRLDVAALRAEPAVLNVSSDGTQIVVTEFPDLVLDVESVVEADDGFRTWRRGRTSPKTSHMAAQWAIQRTGLAPGRRRKAVARAVEEALRDLHVHSDNSPIADMHCLGRGHAMFSARSSFSMMAAVFAKSSTVLVTGDEQGIDATLEHVRREGRGVDHEALVDALVARFGPAAAE